MSVGLPHHYAALGVDFEAPHDTLRAVWREAVQRWHPDALAHSHPHGGGVRLMAVNEAYQVLSDLARRKAYDEALIARAEARLGASARGPLGGVLDRLVGIGRRGPRGGRNRRMKVDVPFAEAFRGKELVVALEVGEGCQDCDAAGFGPDGRPWVCERCCGLGEVLDRTSLRSAWEACGACRQRGYESLPACARCAGHGLVVGVSRLKIPVPPGTESGTVLRVRGAGEVDPQGGPPGDLLVEVTVRPDPRMTQRGRDLHLARPIPLWVALAGGSVPVPTPHGIAWAQVPSGLRDREVLRLRGWGVRAADGAGDALVDLTIEWPADLDAQSLARLRAWGETLPGRAFPESSRYDAVLAPETK